MGQDQQTAGNGRATRFKESVAERVASGGIRTMKHKANFDLGVAIDANRGVTGPREAAAIIRASTEARKSVMDGHKIGHNKEVFDGPGGDCATQSQSDRERELLAELEEIRGRRSGG